MTWALTRHCQVLSTQRQTHLPAVQDRQRLMSKDERQALVEVSVTKRPLNHEVGVRENRCLLFAVGAQRSRRLVILGTVGDLGLVGTQSLNHEWHSLGRRLGQCTKSHPP